MEDIDGSGHPLIPGVNQSINDPAKYTSNQIVYDKLLLEPSEYPPLFGATPIPYSPLNGIQGFLRQYNTIQEHNPRMSSSNHWVRSFSRRSKGYGGGHTYAEGKKQTIEVGMFK